MVTGDPAALVIGDSASQLRRSISSLKCRRVGNKLYSIIQDQSDQYLLTGEHLNVEVHDMVKATACRLTTDTTYTLPTQCRVS